MTSSDGLVCYRSPSVNMIWKRTFVAMEDDGHISKEEINESRKQTVLISVCKPSEPPLPLGLSREEYMEIKLQWKNFCKKLLLILQDRSDSVMIVVEFGAFAQDFIPLPNDERKFKRLQCCHPHFILIQFAREEDVCEFVLEIAGSYRMTNEICEEDVSTMGKHTTKMLIHAHNSDESLEIVIIGLIFLPENDILLLCIVKTEILRLRALITQ